MKSALGQLGKLGLGRLNLAAGGLAWTPARLFTGSEVGGWWDVSDLSTMWQEDTQTTPAAVGSPVGHVNDKSGNDNHLSQATAAKRPILRQSGSLYYLEFDGVDDFLRAIFTIAQPIVRVSGLRQVTWTLNDQIFGGENANGGLLYQNDVTPKLRIFDGSGLLTNGDATLGTNVVVTERHDDANSRLAVDNGAYATAATGTNVPGGIRVGANFVGTQCSDIWWFGATMIDQDLSDANIALLRTFHGSQAGLSL